jgi:uncharacterized protein YxeA
VYLQNLVIYEKRGEKKDLKTHQSSDKRHHQYHKKNPKDESNNINKGY